MELHLQQNQGEFILEAILDPEAGCYSVVTLGSFISPEEALCLAQTELNSGAYSGGLHLSGFEEEVKAEL